MMSNIVISTFLLLNPLLVIGFEETGFNSKPVNTTVTEGDEAYLTCIAKYEGGSQGLSTTWLRNDVLLSDLRPDKYKILSSANKIAILVVKKVSRIDSSYKFTCVIRKDEEIIHKALPVYLTIEQVPSSAYPECEIESIELVEGKPALAKCYVERINPEPQLKWFRQGQELLSNTIITDHYIILQHEFIPQMSDNGNMLMCSMTTSAKANYVSNCSTGLLNVDYRPRVKVTGPKSVAVGDEVLFVCSSQAKPPIHAIQWIFEPPLPEQSYIFETKRLVLRIFKAQLKENGTKLKCIVTNTVGTNSSELRLVVMKDTIKTIDSRPTVSPKQTNTGKNYEGKPQNINTAMILSIAGCTLLLSTLLITMILCYHHICRIHRQTLSMAGEQIAQPQVYFEPKDMISPLPQPDYNHYIWRTVGIQVPSDGDIESVYTEIDEGKKRVTSLKSISV